MVVSAFANIALERHGLGDERAKGEIHGIHTILMLWEYVGMMSHKQTARQTSWNLQIHGIYNLQKRYLQLLQ